MKRTLSEKIEMLRTDRPDEWTMDEFIRDAKSLEAQAAKKDETIKRLTELVPEAHEEGYEDGYIEGCTEFVDSNSKKKLDQILEGEKVVHCWEDENTKNCDCPDCGTSLVDYKG